MLGLKSTEGTPGRHRGTELRPSTDALPLCTTVFLPPLSPPLRRICALGFGAARIEVEGGPGQSSKFCIGVCSNLEVGVVEPINEPFDVGAVGIVFEPRTPTRGMLTEISSGQEDEGPVGGGLNWPLCGVEQRTEPTGLIANPEPAYGFCCGPKCARVISA